MPFADSGLVSETVGRMRAEIERFKKENARPEPPRSYQLLATIGAAIGLTVFCVVIVVIVNAVQPPPGGPKYVRFAIFTICLAAGGAAVAWFVSGYFEGRALRRFDALDGMARRLGIHFVGHRSLDRFHPCVVPMLFDEPSFGQQGVRVTVLAGGEAEGGDVLLVEYGATFDPLNKTKGGSRAIASVMQSKEKRVVNASLQAVVLPNALAEHPDLLLFCDAEPQRPYFESLLQEQFGPHWIGCDDAGQTKAIFEKLSSLLEAHPKLNVHLLSGTLVVWESTWNQITGLAVKTADEYESDVRLAFQISEQLRT